MSHEYWARCATIASMVQDAMAHRMVQRGDFRPLFVYVSHVDGGVTVGHEGQHEGVWRSEQPVATGGTPYSRVIFNVTDLCRSAPLYATPAVA